MGWNEMWGMRERDRIGKDGRRKMEIQESEMKSEQVMEF